jgi:hypothetical protein
VLENFHVDRSRIDRPRRPMSTKRRALHVPATHRLRILLACQVAVLLTYPYLDASRDEVGILSLLLSVVCVAALYAAGDRERVPRLGLGLGVLTVVGLWWPVDADSPIHLTALGLEAGLFLYVTCVLIAHVFRMEEVTEDTLSGAACAYLFMGLAWATIYLLLERVQPGSFHFGGERADVKWSDLLYFSLTSLTTTGYGDITPLSHPARSMTSIQHVLGVLYPAVVLARLVGLYKGRTTGA